jgi:predicted PurR-regulated permease PerM
MEQAPTPYARRVLVTAGLAVSVILFLLMLDYAISFFLLAFSGILFAVFLRSLSAWLSDKTGLAPGWAILLTLVLLAVVLGIGAWLLAPVVADQAVDLKDRLAQSIEQGRKQVERHAWSRDLIARTADVAKHPQLDLVARMAGAFSSAIDVLISLVVVLIVGFYLAIDPDLYLDGVVRLAPIDKRRRAREILDEIGRVLRSWLIGKFVAMVSIGALATAGLWLLGIPLALVLGLITAVLELVPYFGAILSFVPAVLLAFVMGPIHALYVTLLYVGLHIVEGYILVPWIQHRAVSLPPALIIAAQVLLGLLLGAFGLVLAVPLTAVALVVVRRVYVEDILRDYGETPR